MSIGNNRRLSFGAILASLAALALPAASHAESVDPIGDMINKLAQRVEPILETFGLRATLYHGGGTMGARDSLGCKVVPMRTAAVTLLDCCFQVTPPSVVRRIVPFCPTAVPV